MIFINCEKYKLQNGKFSKNTIKNVLLKSFSKLYK